MSFNNNTPLRHKGKACPGESAGAPAPLLHVFQVNSGRSFRQIMLFSPGSSEAIVFGLFIKG
jgi:hypothetical protein